ncbi:secreted protein [Streptomyces viridochromogenes DSM 40736]|uniref:Secreted protein n=1 Tax=Streptomyces viridochromogenes (strain DSM 40736 / JCM 4977 / BCRC 1201 / Tue 494) TaxID=591159 RepID=D9X034_STRVT|nr:secreted protein [Streptomyces viridochromogenes DSM 40736]
MLKKLSGRRAAAMGTAVSTIAGAIIFAGSGTAQAATTCPGSRIDRLSFDTGWVDLYYSNGANCVITTSRTPGVKLRMIAELEVLGGTKKTDSGYYSYHAGPVSLYANGACVRFRGQVGTTGDISGWGHCG